MILPTRWPTAEAMRISDPRADDDSNSNGNAGANDGDNNNLLNRDYGSGDAVTRPTVITPPTSPSALRAQRSLLPVLNEDDTSVTAEPTSPRFNRDREAPLLRRVRSDSLPAAHSSASPMAPRPLPTITTTITTTPTTPATTSRPTTPASSVSLGSSTPPVRRHIHSSSTTILAAAERQQRSQNQASTTREGNHHRHAPSSSVGGPSASDRLRHQQPLVQQANILPPLQRERQQQQQQPGQAQAQAQAQAPPATNVSPAATAASYESAGAKKAEALAGVQSSHSGGRRPPNLVENEMARFGDGGGAAAATGHAHHPLHHRHPSMPLLQQREHHHHQAHLQQHQQQHQQQHKQQLPPLQEHQQIQNLPQHQQHQRHQQQPIEHNGRRLLHRSSPSSSTIIAGRPAIAITPPTSAPVALNFQRYRRKDFSTEEEFLHQRRKASISTPFNFVHVSHTPRPQTAPQPELEQIETPVEEPPKAVPANTTNDTATATSQKDISIANDNTSTDTLTTAAAIAAADRSMPRKERARTRVDELRAKIHRELGVEELQPRSDLFASQSSLLFGRQFPSSTANSPASASPSSPFASRPPGLLRKASTPELYSSASGFYSQNVTANRVDQKMQATYIPKGYVPELPSASMTALNLDFPAPLPEPATGRRSSDAAAWPLSRPQPPRAQSAAEVVRYELAGAEMSPISPPDAPSDRTLPPTPAPPIQVIDTMPTELPASVPVEDSDEGEVTVWPRPGGRRFSRLRLLPARLSRLTEESRSQSPVEDDDYSWETDVDFLYEHAAESTCDFDWASVKPILQPKATAAANSSCESLHSANVPNRMPLLSTARSNSSLSARGSPSPMSDNFRGEHRRGSSVGHRGFLAARNAGTTPTTPSSVLSLDPFAYVELDAGLESPALGRNNWDMSEKQVVMPVLAPPTPIATPISAQPPLPPTAPSQRAPRIDSANAMPGANELKTIAELPADVAIPANAVAQAAPSDDDDFSSELNSYRSAESRQSNSSSLAPSSARSSKDAMTLLSDDDKGNNTNSTPRSSAGSVSAFPIPPKSPLTHVRSKSSVSSAGAVPPPPPPKDALVERSGITTISPPPIPARTIATTGKVAAAIRSFSNAANHPQPKDREIVQAAGRAVQRGRPSTPHRFSKLLEPRTSTQASPHSPQQTSTFA